MVDQCGHIKFEKSEAKLETPSLSTKIEWFKYSRFNSTLLIIFACENVNSNIRNGYFLWRLGSQGKPFYVEKRLLWGCIKFR